MFFSTEISGIPKVDALGFFSPKGEWQHFFRKNDDDSYIIYFMISGDMYIEENSVKYHLKAGDMLLLEPSLIHNGYKKAACNYFYIHFKNISLKRDGNSNLKLPKTYNFSDLTIKSHILNITEEMVSRRFIHRSLRDTYLSAKLIELLSEISTYCFDNFPTTVAEELAEKIKAFIKLHFSEKITGKILEDNLNMNFDYMNKVFKKVNNITIFEYLKRVRINRATQLLTLTDKKCYEVAFETGFENEFYFNKVFKNYIGVSPNKYRREKVAKI